MGTATSRSSKMVQNPSVIEEPIGGGTLPYDEDLERAILGAVIAYPEESDLVFSKVKPEDFFFKQNQVLYHTLFSIYSNGEVLDPLSIKLTLQKEGKYEEIGGMDYILRLIDDAAPAPILPQLINYLKEKRVLRSLVQASQTIANKVKNKPKDVSGLLGEVDSLISEITENKETTPYFSLKDVMKETLSIVNELVKKEGIVTGIPTGFREIDNMTTGFHPGEFIIIAARPGMGKTAFGLSILHYLSVVKGIPTAFFSLEMSKEQIGMRLLAEETGVPLKKIRSGSLSEGELTKVVEASLKLMGAPLYIDDTASMSMFDLKVKAKKLKKEADIKLIVVDYLQLLSSGKKTENRQQEVAEISKSLKALAKELGVPIVSLAQLSRQVEQRADKRPLLSDLRESGAIEQDADIVMFIHREEYYNRKRLLPQESGVAEIIIAKQRNGATGTITLGFIRELVKFVDLNSFDDDLTEEFLEDNKPEDSKEGPVEAYESKPKELKETTKEEVKGEKAEVAVKEKGWEDKEEGKDVQTTPSIYKKPKIIGEYLDDPEEEKELDFIEVEYDDMRDEAPS